MKWSRCQTRSSRNRLTVCLLSCLLISCTYVGPSALRSGRLAYNEAIIETDNQQILLAVVRHRYSERSSLLAVASITANVSVTTNTGVQLGFGNDGNFAGNLVPFSAGVVYEENPTISYAPVVGEKYARRLMSPVPIAALAQLAGSLVDPAPIYSALVSSVNGIYNPEFVFAASQPDPRFSRLVTILTELTQARRLHWVEDLQHEGRFSIVIDHYSPTFAAEVSELLGMLGLPAPKKRSSRVVLPVSLSLDGRDSGGVGIITRSVFNLVEVLSAAVELPGRDQEDGVSIRYPPLGLVGKGLHVRRSEAEPEHASVAVKFRDGWFYIDNRDPVTKGYFRILIALWSATISDSTAGSAGAPVLTVPVSR